MCSDKGRKRRQLKLKPDAQAVHTDTFSPALHVTLTILSWMWRVHQESARALVKVTITEPWLDFEGAIHPPAPVVVLGTHSLAWGVVCAREQWGLSIAVLSSSCAVGEMGTRDRCSLGSGRCGPGILRSDQLRFNSNPTRVPV